MIKIRSPLFTIQSLFNDLEEIIIPKIDMTDATLINTYKYSEGNLSYEQKVYRLKDHSIYVENKQVEDLEISKLEKLKNKAIREENFEYAAALRDQISKLQK